MQSKQHWEKVYSSKQTDQVSWFQVHAELSLKIIRENNVPLDGKIIDVGGGASTLVDDLIASGYSDISVLDLSAVALEKAQSRLGEKALSVRWLVTDILEVGLPENSIDLWHDRAVFHFLISKAERQTYVKQALSAVKPSGLLIVATFAEDGPEKCSGLPVKRYSTSALHAEFGELFELLGSVPERHFTPAGNEQKFVYCIFRRSGQ